MIPKILSRKFFITLIFLIICKAALSEDIDDHTIISSGTETNQQKFIKNNISLTIKDGATLSVSIKPAHINSKSGATVTVESGGKITGDSNGISGTSTSNLTVNNSGTIEVTGAKAIGLKGASGSNITNNAGGIIKSGGHSIAATEGAADTTENIKITNSGTIYTTDSGSNAIKFENDADNNTLTNNSGGIIYNTSSIAVIQLGGSSTITNSGTIENKESPSNNAIHVKGSNSTITLKGDGKVIGIIKSTDGQTGNKLQIQHGFGQGYFYETSGDFTLEDLDGNQVVKGSAGSVGQGGSETLDELLGYKSLNIRKSLNRYKKSKSF